MWMHCDDHGNHPAKLMQLKAECFPCDAFKKSDMEAMVGELLKARLLVEYDGGDGARYWHVTGWKHQLINRPGEPKYPTFTEDSVRDQGAPLPEGKGRESKGKESKGKEGNIQGRARSLDEVREFFREKGTAISPDEFWAYYEANGWRQSNGNPIKNWRACLTTWEARETKNGKAPAIPKDFRI